VSFLLTVVGILLLLVGALLLFLALAAVVFGLVMAFDQRTRQFGLFFALWWVPAVAAAGGILMWDLATFAIGVFCFAVAGAAYALEHRSLQRASARGRRANYENAKGGFLFEKRNRWLSERAKRCPEVAKRWLFKKAKDRGYRRDAS
jgi:membrane-bound ClpP family serine protease